MKIPVIILLLCLAASGGFSQSWADEILPPDNLTARDNNKMLVKGFLLQTAGIGLCIASVYIWNDVPEDQYGVPLTGFGVGVAATLVGSFWIFAGSAYIIKVHHSMHHMKKAEKQQHISFNIEPTKYGVGLVCRF
jgi:hypothetical protein